MLIMRLPKIVIIIVIITAICITIHQPITAAIMCSCATTRIPIIIQAILIRMASTSSIATPPIPIPTQITTLPITTTALITATTCS